MSDSLNPIHPQRARGATAKVYAAVTQKRAASTGEPLPQKSPVGSARPRARLADVYQTFTTTQTSPTTTTNGDSA